MKGATPLTDPARRKISVPRRIELRLAAVEGLTFDATGTLLSVRGGVGRVYAAIAAEQGIGLDAGAVQGAFARALRRAPPLAFGPLGDAERAAAERAWWREVVARTVMDASGAIGEEPGRTAPPEGRRFEAFFEALYARFAQADVWRAEEGAVEVLAELRRRGYRLGVLSNADGRLPPLVAALGLAPYLSCVETSSRLGVAKPDPRAFGRTLASLGATPSRAAHVGDSPLIDAAGAAAAGLLPVLLRAPLPEGLEGVRIQRLGDLLDLFGGPRSFAAGPALD